MKNDIVMQNYIVQYVFFEWTQLLLEGSNLDLINFRGFQFRGTQEQYRVDHCIYGTCKHEKKH